MDYDPVKLLRVLGDSTRLWAAAGQHEVHQEWWLALSGESNVSMNLACCQSANPNVLRDHCLQPMLDLGKPGIIMLGGPGLSTAQTLIDAGWVSVGAMPLMLMTAPPAGRLDVTDVRAISLEELVFARKIIADGFTLDPSSVEAVLPDSVADRTDIDVWGLYEAGQMVSSVTNVREDDIAVVWSMATRRESQGQGYGRRLLEMVLHEQFENGVTGSLLHSSRAGEPLYRNLGYSVVEYLQMWSRPRWILGSA